MHFLFSLLGVRFEFRILAFPQIFRFDRGSSINKAIIKQNTNNACDMVRFHVVTLFSFYFASNILMTLLATNYDACSFFLA